MSRGVNKVFLLGNVGADPDVKDTRNGTKVARVSLATNRSWSDKDGNRHEQTEWHRLTFWDKLAEIVEEYVRKGDKLHVEGRIQYSQIEDDKGKISYYTDIIVESMTMLGSPGVTREGDEDQPVATPAARQRQRPQSSSERPSDGARKVRRPAPAGSQRKVNPFDDEDEDIPF